MSLFISIHSGDISKEYIEIVIEFDLALSFIV